MDWSDNDNIDHWFSHWLEDEYQEDKPIKTDDKKDSIDWIKRFIKIFKN